MCKHARACMQSVFGLYVPMLQGLMLVRRLHGRSCPGVHEGELVSLHFGAILRTHSKGALKAPSCKLQLQQLWTAAACPQLLLSPPLPFSTVAFKVSVCISWPPVYPDYCRELSMLDGMSHAARPSTGSMCWRETRSKEGRTHTMRQRW